MRKAIICIPTYSFFHIVLKFKRNLKILKWLNSQFQYMSNLSSTRHRDSEDILHKAFSALAMAETKSKNGLPVAVSNMFSIYLIWSFLLINYVLEPRPQTHQLSENPQKGHWWSEWLWPEVGFFWIKISDHQSLMLSSNLMNEWISVLAHIIPRTATYHTIRLQVKMESVWVAVPKRLSPTRLRASLKAKLQHALSACVIANIITMRRINDQLFTIL